MLETPDAARALRDLSRAQAAKAAIDFLGDELFGKQQQIDLAVFRKLEAGEPIDPQWALQMWMEKWAVWQFQSRLMKTLKSGEGAARTLAPMMEGNHA